ncbi:MAG: right-handed parallel beta-helix repeat-containing protein [Pseudomonadota bacterium]
MVASDMGWFGALAMDLTSAWHQSVRLARAMACLGALWMAGACSEGERTVFAPDLPSDVSLPADKAHVLRSTIRSPSFRIPAATDKADVCLDGSCQFTSLRAAFKAASDGDVITLAPGDYPSCLDMGDKSIALVGRIAPSGARARFTKACARKAAFVSSARKVLLQGLEISGITVPDKNGACVRLSGKGKRMRVALVDIVCTDSENGVLGSPGDGTVRIEGSHFLRNGGNDGYAHGLYIDGGAEVLLKQSVIAGTKERGHSLKIGAKRLIIESSIVAGLTGSSSRTLDFYAGGTLVIKNSILQQGPNADNNDMIAIGMEPLRAHEDATHLVWIEGSTLVFDDADRPRRLVFAGRALGPVRVARSTLAGFTDTRIMPDAVADVQIYAGRSEAGFVPFDGTLATLPAQRRP